MTEDQQVELHNQDYKDGYKDGYRDCEDYYKEVCNKYAGALNQINLLLFSLQHVVPHSEPLLLMRMISETIQHAVPSVTPWHKDWDDEILHKEKSYKMIKEQILREINIKSGEEIDEIKNMSED